MLARICGVIFRVKMSVFTTAKELHVKFSIHIKKADILVSSCILRIVKNIYGRRF